MLHSSWLWLLPLHCVLTSESIARRHRVLRPRVQLLPLLRCAAKGSTANGSTH
jgi:hypothetical protein